MQVRKISYLIILIFIAACAQIRSINLPEGVSLLQGINYSGLRSPIWSPDGKRIVASYVIEAMPDDVAGFLGPEPRHDIVVNDTETWKSSVLISEESGSLDAEAWSPDSSSFAMYWSNGPNGYGIYVFQVNNSQPTYISNAKFGVVSPDFGKVAVFKGPDIEIIDLNTHNIDEFKVSADGEWSVYTWSPDMKQLTLTYRTNESDRYENIYLLDVSSGTFSQFTDENSYFKYSPTISPDGQLIAYTIWRYSEGAVEDKLIVSRLDHSCTWVMPIDDVGGFAWSPDNRRMFLSGTDGVYIADLDKVFGNSFSNGYNCP